MSDGISLFFLSFLELPRRLFVDLFEASQTWIVAPFIG